MKKHILIVLTYLFCLSSIGMAQAPKTVETVNKQKEWYSNFFSTHILECKKVDNETITIQSDGFILSKEGESNFSVKVKDEFGTPDHHSMTTYTLKQIDQNGAVIAYESTFNHTSFGQNLITIDTGEIFINFTSIEH